MSEAEHWLYAKDKVAEYFDDYVVKESGSPLLIARVFGGKGRNARDTARLIAAAPDLLQACKLLQAALTEYNLRDVKKRYSLCVADAAASKAIAKAESEAKNADE